MTKSQKHRILGITTAFILLTCLPLHSNAQIVCQLNPNCFDGCSDSTCVYDPSTNPFYNSSLSDNTGAYNGPYCCEGCNSGYFLWMDVKTCSQKCSMVTGVQTFGNPLTRTCDFVCPEPYLGDPTTTRCVARCPTDYWVNLNTSRCVFYCPDELVFYYTPERMCMVACEGGNYTYKGDGNRVYCAPSCPGEFFAYDSNMTCVGVCPNDFYANLMEGKCVEECPLGTYKHLGSKKCESVCFGSYPYADRVSNFCVKVCPFNQISQNQTYGQNSTSLCVQTCPQGSYAHKEVKICVSECFGNYSDANDTTNMCETYSPKVQGSYFPKITLIIVISVTSGSILVLAVSSLLVYKFYAKKRIVRKSWKYDYLKDVQFYL